MAGDADQEEIERFETEMSAEGLDSQHADMQGGLNGADSADPMEGEADADAEAQAPEGDAGDTAEANELDPASADVGGFRIPEGYESLQDYIEKTQQERQQLEAQANQAQHGAAFAAQQAQALQAQIAAQQQQRQQHVPDWARPQGQVHPEVLMAAQLIGDPESFGKFRPDVQQQAQALVARQREIQQRFFTDPVGFVRQFQAPETQREVAGLRQELALLKAESFRRQHSEFLGTDEGTREFVQLSQQAPRDLAFTVMRLQKQVQDLSRSNADQQRKQKDGNAKRNARRGVKAPRGRAGNPQAPELPKHLQASASAIADQVIEEFL